LNSTIAITGFSSLSALGTNPDGIWTNYLDDKSYFSTKIFDNQPTIVASLNTDSCDQIEALRLSDSKYKSLDATVMYAILVSRLATQQAGWWSGSNFGVNFGSSRGATDLFEKHYQHYLTHGIAQTLASPTTTLGNISSWVAHDLQTTGPEISHSITCSTALHSLLNGVAWLKSGMATHFLVGGSEAPLTDFTIAQMRALKIYTKLDDKYPNRALDLDKTQNTMVLGEGAAACCLELGNKAHALAHIIGLGYATELLEHNISISAEATCFQKSMKMAIGDSNPNEVDAIVMHAPGTIKGDLTEYKAIQKLFGSQLPLLTSNKWKIGHTFGASGMLSLELAIMMLQHNHFINVPYVEKQEQTKPIKKVMVNAVGFGGNAVSVLLSL
jgi:3-oxoacyl-(acyl-carrier-protein) synthase